MKHKRKWLFLLFSLLSLSLMMMTSLEPTGLFSPTVIYSDEPDDSPEEEPKDDPPIQSEPTVTGTYEQMQVPARLSTAYYQGYARAQAQDMAKDGQDAKDQMAAIQSNINHILDMGFYNVGALYGPVELTGPSSAGNVLAKHSASMKTMDEALGGPNGTAGRAYHAFGWAFTQLQSDAQKMKANAFTGAMVSEMFTGMASQIAEIGLKMVRWVNPAPVILALGDSSELTNANNGDNVLIKAINNSPPIRNVVTFLGDPAPNLSISVGTMMTIVIALISSGLALFSLMFNGRKFGITLRKNAVRILVVILAIPLSARLMAFGINTLDSTINDSKAGINRNLVRTNLDLQRWAIDAKFGLPQGATIEVKDGEFVLDENTIEKINLYSYYTAGLINDQSSTEANYKKIVDEMSATIGTNNNRVAVNWVEEIRSRDGVPYKTERLNRLANAMGAAESFDEDEDIQKDLAQANSIGYLDTGGLSANGGGSSWTYTMGGKTYGMAPIAAYNLLNTTFTKTSFRGTSNVATPMIPGVAIAASGYNSIGTVDAEDESMPGWVSLLLSIVMVWAATKALANIFTSGLGGTFRGGAGSAVGRADSAGTLVGGVIALVGGVFGIALIITFLNYLVGSVWSMANVLLSEILGDALDATFAGSVLKGIKDVLSYIPLFGGLLTTGINSIGGMGISLITAFLMPPLVRMPIQAAGEWFASLPDRMGNWAQMMENRFTGDYRAGGRSGGGRSGAVGQAYKSQARAVKQGSALAAGGLGGLMALSVASISNKLGGGTSISGDSSVANDTIIDDNNMFDSVNESVNQTDSMSSDSQQSEENVLSIGGNEDSLNYGGASNMAMYDGGDVNSGVESNMNDTNYVDTNQSEQEIYDQDNTQSMYDSFDHQEELVDNQGDYAPIDGGQHNEHSENKAVMTDAKSNQSVVDQKEMSETNMTNTGETPMPITSTPPVSDQSNPTGQGASGQTTSNGERNAQVPGTSDTMSIDRSQNNIEQSSTSTSPTTDRTSGHRSETGTGTGAVSVDRSQQQHVQEGSRDQMTMSDNHRTDASMKQSSTATETQQSVDASQMDQVNRSNYGMKQQTNISAKANMSETNAPHMTQKQQDQTNVGLTQSTDGRASMTSRTGSPITNQNQRDQSSIVNQISPNSMAHKMKEVTQQVKRATPAPVRNVTGSIAKSTKKVGKAAGSKVVSAAQQKAANQSISGALRDTVVGTTHIAAGLTGNEKLTEGLVNRQVKKNQQARQSNNPIPHEMVSSGNRRKKNVKQKKVSNIVNTVRPQASTSGTRTGSSSRRSVNTSVNRPNAPVTRPTNNAPKTKSVQPSKDVKQNKSTA